MPLFEINQEYQTLRSELREGIRWIFERPLLIVTICAAAFKFLEKSYLVFIPPSITALLLFNLWFTANRLRSAARIVAYIQVVLESDDKKNWRGWETFLREYRRWKKSRSKKEVRRIVEEKLDKSAIPDSMMFYPPIFMFHIIIVLSALVISFCLAYNDRSVLFICMGACTALAAIIFFIYAYMFRPSLMRVLIEENIVVCREVMNERMLKDNVSEEV
nr:hypothetical protein [candidate division Zixibacteria bacterium]